MVAMQYIEAPFNGLPPVDGHLPVFQSHWVTLPIRTAFEAEEHARSVFIAARDGSHEGVLCLLLICFCV